MYTYDRGEGLSRRVCRTRRAAAAAARKISRLVIKYTRICIYATYYERERRWCNRISIVGLRVSRKRERRRFDSIPFSARPPASVLVRARARVKHNGANDIGT